MPRVRTRSEAIARDPAEREGDRRTIVCWNNAWRFIVSSHLVRRNKIRQETFAGADPFLDQRTAARAYPSG
jgi:hypothetical protein